MKNTPIEGRIWVLEKGGRLIEDIDTDQIFHNAHLHITDMVEMGQYAFGNLAGWEDFPSKAKPGDIIVAGRNFGSGSSRQQAVDCFAALGIAAIVAPSFGAIYFRNAVNSGFPVLRCTELDALAASGKLETGDSVVLDFMAGSAKNLTRGIAFSIEAVSGVQAAVLEAGSLFCYAKRQDWR